MYQKLYYSFFISLLFSFQAWSGILNYNFDLPEEVPPPKYFPKISGNQEGLLACKSFAISTAIESTYARRGEPGVTISPLHLFVYESKNLSWEAKQKRNLQQMYTSNVNQILQKTGPLVPNFILPERLYGFPNQYKQGSGNMLTIDKLGLYEFFNFPDYNFRSYTRNFYDYIKKTSYYEAISELVKTIAENGVVTLSINSSYLDDDFDTYTGLKKIDSLPANHPSRRLSNHEVAVIGYNQRGLIIRNSWNSRDDLLKNESKYKDSYYNSNEISSFKKRYFGKMYVNDVYLIPWKDLILEGTAFEVNYYSFDFDRFLYFFRENQNRVGAVKANYFCKSKTVPSPAVYKAVNEIIADPTEYPDDFDDLVIDELDGYKGTVNFAAIPFYRYPNGDVNLNRVIDFYQNADNKIDDFYCLFNYKPNQIRIPLSRSLNIATKLAWNQLKLTYTTSQSQTRKLWREALMLMFINE
jgi:hypothetical protein